MSPRPVSVCFHFSHILQAWAERSFLYITCHVTSHLLLTEMWVPSQAFCSYISASIFTIFICFHFDFIRRKNFLKKYRIALKIQVLVLMATVFRFNVLYVCYCRAERFNHTRRFKEDLSFTQRDVVYNCKNSEKLHWSVQYKLEQSNELFALTAKIYWDYNIVFLEC